MANVAYALPCTPSAAASHPGSLPRSSDPHFPSHIHSSEVPMRVRDRRKTSRRLASPNQLAYLEPSFARCPTFGGLSTDEKQELARKTRMSISQVKNWYQNKRRAIIRTIRRQAYQNYGAVSSSTGYTTANYGTSPSSSEPPTSAPTPSSATAAPLTLPMDNVPRSFYQQSIPYSTMEDVSSSHSFVDPVMFDPYIDASGNYTSMGPTASQETESGDGEAGEVASSVNGYELAGTYEADVNSQQTVASDWGEEINTVYLHDPYFVTTPLSDLGFILEPILSSSSSSASVTSI